MGIQAEGRRGLPWRVGSCAGVMSLGVEREIPERKTWRQGLVDRSPILWGLAYLVKESGLCFAGKREPVKFSGQGSDMLVAVHKIDSSGKNGQ